MIESWQYFHMKYLIPVSLIVVGVIHLLPLSGALGSERLAALYGIPVEDPNLAILMRHRAVLFGLLGGFLIYAAFRPTLQWLALLGGWGSVLSFLYLCLAVGGYNEQIARVFVADIVALAFLLLGGITYALRHRWAVNVHEENTTTGGNSGRDS